MPFDLSVVNSSTIDEDNLGASMRRLGITMDYFRHHPDQVPLWMEELGPDLLHQLVTDWKFLARDEQLPPTDDYKFWIYLAGRGSGKTRTGAEWSKDLVRLGYTRGGLIAPTAADVRDVMVEGEALALDTPIPTPSGWTTMGELKIGDLVYAQTGQPTEVVAIKDWKDRPCYAMTADRAEPIIADEKHLWLTSTRKERRKLLTEGRRASIKTTAQLAVTLKMREDLYNHEIPGNVQLQGSVLVLPVPAYTLGLWLGDGSSDSAEICCHENDVESIHHVEAEGFTTKYYGNLSYGIHGLAAKLRTAGVLGNKHIPKQYFRAPLVDRLALLQGLMDSDGEVQAKGTCTFSNTNKELVDGFVELATSLGFKCAVGWNAKIKNFKHIYEVQFSVPVNGLCPVRMKRKASRVVESVRATGRLVRSVEYVGLRDTRCIQVAHTSHSFLAGKSMVATHNSGLLAVCNAWDRDIKGNLMGRPIYEPSKRRVTWENGAMVTLYSADEPERLRGPQHSFLWMDELAAWRRMETFDQAMFGLRLGKKPKVFISTTPKPKPLVKKLWARAMNQADKDVVVTTGSSERNAVNLAPGVIEELREMYGGSQLARQELDGVLLEELEGALWARTTIDANRYDVMPTLLDKGFYFLRIVVGVDPATTDKEGSDETGIIVAALGSDNHAYVLADYSGKYSPAAWGKKVAEAYTTWQADMVVAEVNQGGDMVKHVLEGANADMPVKMVHASRGKIARAEPVAQKYEQGKVHHVGRSVVKADGSKNEGHLDNLEDQMCTWERLSAAYSPDRIDALVWCIHELMIESEKDIVTSRLRGTH